MTKLLSGRFPAVVCLGIMAGCSQSSETVQPRPDAGRQPLVHGMDYFKALGEEDADVIAVQVMKAASGESQASRLDIENTFNSVDDDLPAAKRDEGLAYIGSYAIESGILKPGQTLTASPAMRPFMNAVDQEARKPANAALVNATTLKLAAVNIILAGSAKAGRCSTKPDCLRGYLQEADAVSKLDDQVYRLLKGSDPLAQDMPARRATIKILPLPPSVVTPRYR